MSAAIAFPSAIFAIVAAFLATGYFLDDYPWSAFVFPLGAGVATCALCLLQVVSTRAVGALTPDAADEPPSLTTLAWMFSLLLFLYGFGFVFGPAAYLFAYLRASGQTWTLTISIVVSSLLVTWGLFIRVLSVPLPLWPLWWQW
jgi:cytochrome c biogenesis protein CcdA